MNNKSEKFAIAYISTYPPRECGIATFTNDLVTAFDGLFSPGVRPAILAMDKGQEDLFYPPNVKRKILQDDPESYRQAAQYVNETEAIRLVNIEHEFGIFGGEFGAHLLFFLEAVQKPVVTTFHTVLPEPPSQLRKVAIAIAEKSVAVVVMTDLSKDILTKAYAIPEDKIFVIPHGIHALPYKLPNANKTQLGLKGRRVVTTFGLLSRNKGIEYMLEALPAVVREVPETLYLIVGVTHPEIKKTEGESYRYFLEQKVEELGLSDNVIFINHYLELRQLLLVLLATDIYVATGLDPNQAVSGTFSYALGAGRPVIATSFAQARADLNPEIGRLVPFRDPGAYSAALLELLNDKKLRERMGQAAYRKTRHMIWQNVALSFMRVFSSLVPELSLGRLRLLPLQLSHLSALTDSFGIFQFAELSHHNAAFGYALDDNARALQVAARSFAFTRKLSSLKLSRRYLSFLEQGFDETSGEFLNYFTDHRCPDPVLNKKDSLEDTNARALYALMETAAAEYLPADIRERAGKLAQRRTSAATVFTHPRAIAFYLLGMCQKYRGNKSLEVLTVIQEYAFVLMSQFAHHSKENWAWFSDQLTYSNSRLSESLLCAYEATGEKKFLEVGLQTLDFLIEKTFVDKIYIPIGQNGWYERGKVRAYYDQQPEDVASMVLTLGEAFRVTQDPRYRELMYRTFYWFLGENTAGQFMYDPSTGGCYDGLGERSINLNQGAESTISYLLARLALERIEW